MDDEKVQEMIASAIANAKEEGRREANEEHKKKEKEATFASWGYTFLIGAVLFAVVATKSKLPVDKIILLSLGGGVGFVVLRAVLWLFCFI